MSKDPTHDWPTPEDEQHAEPTAAHPDPATAHEATEAEAPASDEAAEHAEGAETPEEQETQKAAKEPFWSQWETPSLYTVMLALSLLFISVACLLLLLELTQFGSYPWWDTSEGLPNV